MSAALDMDDLTRWVGREERAVDFITPALVDRFKATLGSSALGLHWCLAMPTVPMSDVGHDGHPKKGGFLPPVPLQYRMWAAGETTFYSDLPETGEVERHSTIDDVTLKQGRTGPLVFVNVLHRYSAEGRIRLQERQTIVYKETAASAPSHAGDPFAADFEQMLETNSVLLFRYSALTFNGHRIHYDEPYAREVEGYEGIVVHGPMIATCLMQMAGREAERMGVTLENFTFRGVSPAIAGGTLQLLGKREEGGFILQAQDDEGRVKMEAKASLKA
ncbi:MAG: MaoC family dehydratase N-terminal domain-containing protein [Hyphomicrobiales bacterium]